MVTKISFLLIFIFLKKLPDNSEPSTSNNDTILILISENNNILTKII